MGLLNEEVDLISIQVGGCRSKRRFSRQRQKNLKLEKFSLFTSAKRLFSVLLCSHKSLWTSEFVSLLFGTLFTSGSHVLLKGPVCNPFCTRTYCGDLVPIIPVFSPKNASFNYSRVHRNSEHPNQYLLGIKQCILLYL